jgi:hypothetical protein
MTEDFEPELDVKLFEVDIEDEEIAELEEYVFDEETLDEDDWEDS